MTKPGKTHLTILLDRSGSMGEDNKWAGAVEGLKELIRKQQSLPGELTISLHWFDQERGCCYEMLDIKQLDPLEPFRGDVSIRPRGMTALLDAMGIAINGLGDILSQMREEDRPEHVVFFVFTDGHENYSREWSLQKIKDLVKQQTEVYKWTFSYFGANLDTFREAGGIGIKAANTTAISATGQGMSDAMGIGDQMLYSLRCYNVEMSAEEAQTSLGMSFGEEIDQKNLRGRSKTHATNTQGPSKK